MSIGNEQAALDLLTKGWDGFFAGHGRAVLEDALPAWLIRQRWYGGKSRVISKVTAIRWVALPENSSVSVLPTSNLGPASSLGDVLVIVKVTYSDGSADEYQVPLSYSTGSALQELREASASSIVVEVSSPTGPAAFHDATVREEFRQRLLALLEHGGRLPVEDAKTASEHVAATLVAAHESRPAHEVGAAETREIAAAIEAQHSIEPAEVAPEFTGHMPGAAGSEAAVKATHPATGSELRGSASAAFASARAAGPLPGRIGSAEQSNTNILYGQRMILKLFRRLQPGVNPDVEIGRFLTDVAHFERIAPFLGELTVTSGEQQGTTLAMLQGLVANDGDGWEWTLAELAKLFAAASGEEDVEALAGPYLAAAALLGRRTAEMHLALATPTTNTAFAAEPVTAADAERDARRIEAQIGTALDALQARKKELAGETLAQAEAVLAKREELLSRAGAVASAEPSGERIRIHGDYHLGQILRTLEDFVVLDFEGEPAKSLEERRRKQSPLRDVAGMLRSFSYAANAGLQALAAEHRKAVTTLARAWEAAVCSRFLEAYGTTAATSATLLPAAAQAKALLDAYVLEKALYELQYELNNRPAWVGIPLAGLLALCEPAR